MAKVIINADDLGLSSEVNSAIGNALRMGHITSSTILANSDTWDEIHNIVDSNKTASFGVHLNLTQGRSITDSSVLRKYGITDNNNEFSDWRKSNIEFTPELIQAVYEEWDAQVHCIICQHNIPVTHFDGHHHIHTLDILQPCLIRLVNKYRVKSVRNKYVKPLMFSFRKKHKFLPEGNIKASHSKVNIETKSKPHIAYIGFLQRIFNIFSMKLAQIKWTRKIKRNASTTDYFDSYESIYKDICNGCILPSNCTIELMCHPGHERYVYEYLLIESSALQDKVENIELINYKSL